MIDWSKYPLVRLFVPFLLGIIAGYLCTVEWGWTVKDKWAFALIAICVCCTIAAHTIVSKAKYRSKGYIFIMCTSATCFMAGLALSARSHQQALRLYGYGYKYEIYKQNNFQNKQAKKWQEALHQQFAAGGDGSWGEEQAVVEAITIGWRNGLSKELKQSFAQAGISHVLALSGYHVGILFLFLFLGPRHWAKTLAGRWTWHIAILFILWMYALMTGMSPSIVRAVLMCSFITLGKILQRDIRLINSCTLAAFIMLIIDPLLIGHVGFQLSFCCIVGIALMEPWLPRHAVMSGTMLSAVCTFFTFPLVAYHFGSVPLLSLVSNFFAMFLIPVIMLLSGLWWLAALVCSMSDLLSFMPEFVAIPLHWTAWALIELAKTVSHFSFAAIPYRPSLAEVGCWYGAILATISLCYKTTGKRTIALLLMLSGVLFAAISRKTGLPLGFFTE